MSTDTCAPPTSSTIPLKQRPRWAEIRFNANLLFGWRRRHLESLAQADLTSARSPAAVLLPVSIETGPREIHRTPSAPPARPGSGTIEIEIGGALVRLRGPVDDASLRSVLTTMRSLA